MQQSMILTKHDPSVEPFSCPNLPPSSSSSSPSVDFFLSPLTPSGQNNLNVYQSYHDFYFPYFILSSLSVESLKIFEAELSK